jgi:Domain of unknown function (DUF4157)
MPAERQSSRKAASKTGPVRRASPPRTARASLPTQLQRRWGNASTQAFLQSLTVPQASSQSAIAIQPKLTVGSPDDMYEREADTAASRVVAGQPVERISRLPAGGLLQSLWRHVRPEREEAALQRQEMDEEAHVQTQEAPEEEELQQTAVQRQEVNEEEPVQMWREALPVQRMCETCRKEAQRQEEEEEETVQTKPSIARATIDTEGAELAIARSGSGSSLRPALRAQMEAGFGADLSDVRVHSGSAAGEAAQALNARAFTRGPDIYLARGESQTDHRLMGHELAHVMQQSGGSMGLPGSPTALRRDLGDGRDLQHGPVVMRQRLAQHATDIVAVAQDASRPIDERAVEVIQRIIRQYFSNDASKVRNVVYREEVGGLEVDTRSYRPRSGGSNATANILVGRYFVEHVDRRHFARRVQQVRHELDHIDQVRAGMGDPSRARDFRSRRDEREFLAHCRGAFYRPPAGTGRISHWTVVNIIDAAIGHYYCMDRTKQRQYANHLRRLLQKRPDEVRMSGRQFGNPPTTCFRP